LTATPLQENDTGHHTSMITKPRQKRKHHSVGNSDGIAVQMEDLLLHDYDTESCVSSITTATNYHLLNKIMEAYDDDLDSVSSIVCPGSVMIDQGELHTTDSISSFGGVFLFNNNCSSSITDFSDASYPSNWYAAGVVTSMSESMDGCKVDVGAYEHYSGSGQTRREVYPDSNTLCTKYHKYENIKRTLQPENHGIYF